MCEEYRNCVTRNELPELRAVIISVVGIAALVGTPFMSLVPGPFVFTKFLV